MRKGCQGIMELGGRGWSVKSKEEAEEKRSRVLKVVGGEREEVQVARRPRSSGLGKAGQGRPTPTWAKAEELMAEDRSLAQPIVSHQSLLPHTLSLRTWLRYLPGRKRPRLPRLD